MVDGNWLLAMIRVTLGMAAQLRLAASAATAFAR
jgi:hypothetical protein